MTAERTIKQLLSDQGIEVRKTGTDSTRELWRGDAFLGHFTAARAVERFLPPSNTSNAGI